MSTVTAPTITEFILARIAEDEEVAQAAIADDGGYDEGFAGQFERLTKPPSGIGLAQGGFGEAAAAMIATYAVPRRVLAQCEAMRRIVERAAADLTAADTGDPDQIARSFNAGAAHFAHNALLDLAAIWSDHADYNPAWRVQ